MERERESFEIVAFKNTCLYMAGDPKIDNTCCGARRKAGSVYCPEHAELCSLGKKNKPLEPPPE